MLYTADVNNDGQSDIIQTTLSAPIEFTVSLAKGNGTFSAPTAYAFPSGLAASPSLAFADFNGDGKVDILAPLQGEGTMALYFGNGDGTFKAPELIADLLPSGYVYQNLPPVPADYNHDGKMDVVVFAYDSSTNVNSAFLIEGDGKGAFSTDVRNIYNAPSGDGILDPVTGDFNADNNADVAFVTTAYCDQNSAECNGAVHVLYGNGDFGFNDTTPYTTTGGLLLASGDLNGDGITDLFGYNASGQLVLMYGKTNETFETYYYSDVPSGGVTNLAMADFNGDGRMDLVGFDFTDEPNAGPTFQLAFFLAGSSPGTFTTQLYALPYYQTNTNVVVGNFDNNAKPGVAIVQNPAPSGTGNSTIDAVINETASGNWGGCDYPKAGQGISLCTPTGGSSANPVDFKASANSFGDIRKFELWVDGKKLSEQHHSWGQYAWFNLSTTLAAGKHSCTLNVTTVDNDAETHNFTLTVP
ncbi:MAG: VCBS repeat-containing protein [Acidobacteriaceae bacterium]